MMNTSLTYDDLAEAAALMADRLLAAQNENCALNLELSRCAQAGQRIRAVIPSFDRI
jgi:hypothetical protein